MVKPSPVEDRTSAAAAPHERTARGFTIRLKLFSLVGLPIVGALLLAALIITTAQSNAARAQALGSIEDLGHLSRSMSELVHELQMERAMLSVRLGKAARSTESDPSPTGPVANARLQEQFKSTSEARRGLDGFLSSRDMSRMPAQLAKGYEAARARLGDLEGFRERTMAGETSIQEVMEYYEEPIAALITATAALRELSDDGQMLRDIGSLVGVHEVKERQSREHALIGYVFAAGQFPPGTFKSLVTTISEAATYVDVVRTSTNADSAAEVDALLASETFKEAGKLRKVASESTEDEFDVDPDVWFEKQAACVDALRKVESRINQRIRVVASRKVQTMRTQIYGSLGLTAAAILLSAIVAGFIARGISRAIHELQQASRLVAAGDLKARVNVRTRDELGALGHAFNDMTQEISRSRAALREHERMARELEIAATIQEAILPPRPHHPDFDFVGRMRPADEVGGDFYDVLTNEDESALWLTVGDVSSHGLGAGLVMLIAQAAFSSFFRASPDATPDEVLRGVNLLLRENINERLKDNKYVTAQLLVYRGDGRFVVGGAHQWPIVYRAATKEVEILELTGPWLGIVAEFEEVPLTDIVLGAGDILCLYSDGITEARNEQGELFDVPRLAETLRSGAEGRDDLDALADHILETVERYGGPVREDDQSLLLVRRRAE